MKRIVVQVSWSEKNYCGGWGDPALGAVLSTGKTLEAFKQEFEDALRFHIEGMAESGTAPEWAVKGEYEVEYSLHISAVLRQAEQYTTMSAVSRVSGVNATLLRHYASSLKEPRKHQRDKIVRAIHEIGNEMLALG